MIRLIIALVLTWAISQSLKVLISFLMTKKFDWKILYRDGGMPSSHSSIVAALATSVYFLEGFSVLFVVVLVFAAIILRDAMGVRLESQKHAIAINKLTKSKLTEHIGHTFIQVVVGVLIGILVTGVVFLV